LASNAASAENERPFYGLMRLLTTVLVSLHASHPPGPKRVAEIWLASVPNRTELRSRDQNISAVPPEKREGTERTSCDKDSENTAARYGVRMRSMQMHGNHIVHTFIDQGLGLPFASTAHSHDISYLGRAYVPLQGVWASLLPLEWPEELRVYEDWKEYSKCGRESDPNAADDHLKNHFFPVVEM
jgi:hypothetical protein